ncbi:MAG: hypothetical protein KDK04_25055 [Candidatus Competibacteraceae bacterium]|nr:hypothetical protein [Candidatus Competibacteraceae bacterium]
MHLELSWTHYRQLIRLENPAARSWYTEEAISQEKSQVEQEAGSKPPHWRNDKRWGNRIEIYSLTR